MGHGGFTIIPFNRQDDQPHAKQADAEEICRLGANRQHGHPFGVAANDSGRVERQVLEDVSPAFRLRPPVAVQHGLDRAVLRPGRDPGPRAAEVQLAIGSLGQRRARFVDFFFGFNY